MFKKQSNKLMKKTLSILVASLCAFSLAGCNSSNDPKTPIPEPEVKVTTGIWSSPAYGVVVDISDDEYNTFNHDNIIELNFNVFINTLSDSIDKCVMCGIYDKHFTEFKYIDYYYTKKGYYCNYCENVFNKDKLILFIMNNIIKII